MVVEEHTLYSSFGIAMCILGVVGTLSWIPENYGLYRQEADPHEEIDFVRFIQAMFYKKEKPF